MEWLVYGGAALYLVVVIIYSFICESTIPAEQPKRTLLIFLTSFGWPIGLVVYFCAPGMKKYRDQINAEVKEKEQEEAERYRLKQRAGEGYRVGMTDIVDRLRRQRDNMVKNLEECEDEAGRVFLQESIEKTDALLAKFDPPREVA